MKLQSRPNDTAEELIELIYADAKQELTEVFAAELDNLINNLDSFLEVRIRHEFDELVADLLADNHKLLKENYRLTRLVEHLESALDYLRVPWIKGDLE